jgi:hypothetical protein
MYLIVTGHDEPIFNECYSNKLDLSRAEYLKEFDADKNGPIHNQIWAINAMYKFHNNLYKLNQYHCKKCNEMWPSIHNECHTCSLLKLQDQHMFTDHNNMDPKLDYLPVNVKHLFESLTMVEEMLIAPILPFMCIHRTSSGKYLSKVIFVNM